MPKAPDAPAIPAIEGDSLPPKPDPRDFDSSRAALLALESWYKKRDELELAANNPVSVRKEI